MKYDEILVVIGQFGPYQKRVFFFWTLPCFLSAFVYLTVIFTMAIPNYRCKIPQYSSDTFKIQSPLHRYLINLTIPMGENDLPYNECNFYSDVNVSSLLNVSSMLKTSFEELHTSFGNSSLRNTRICDEWVYDRTEHGDTFMTEFNAVCDDKIIRSHTNMVQFAGGLVGAIGIGIFADVFGRKKAIVLSVVLQFVSSLGVFLMPYAAGIITIKFVYGIAEHGLFQTGATVGIELVGPKKRTIAGIAPQFSWIVGAFCVLPLAYFVRDWRHIQLFIVIMSASFFVLCWFMPESPRWLIEQKKYKEAEEVFKKIYTSNKTKLPPNCLDESTTNEGPTAEWWKLFTHRVLIIRYLIVFINWFACNLLYYGLSLNIDNLGGNIYLNFFIGNVVEVLAYIVCLFLMNKTGRRSLYCSFTLLGGVACLAVIFPVVFGNDDHQWITTTLVMISKFCTSGSYAVIYIMSAELFPTVFRHSGLGMCSILESVGGMVSPYIADLGILIGGSFAQATPMVAFGSISIIAGGLAFLLPETLHSRLPESIQDVIDFGIQDKMQNGNGNSHIDEQDDIELVPLRAQGK